ncbi:IclR family transcriptional regulator [Salibacterium aidingense]|uniref:IclR family transcriptional regulator n=1 Tax=Salibacterium aidingense TaxID=384933 RepID=UPI003BD8703C
MKPSNTDKYQLSSVRNAMKILQLFKSSVNNDLGVSDISKKTALPKSTTHRLISYLTQEGFLSKNPRTGQYRLGLSLLTLGGVISVHKEIYKEAFPLVEALVKEIEETCHICLLENKQVVYFYKVNRENPETLETEVGRKNPIHCTSEGLVLLAYQDKAFIEDIAREDLKQYTGRTITNPHTLKMTLEAIKRDGYAITTEHLYEGYTGIAVPVRDYSSNVVSSLAMVGASDRLQEAKYPYYIKQLKKAASDISEALGFYGDV